VTFKNRAVNAILRVILRTACRTELSQLDKVPQQGPMIIAVNHINFLEVPMIASHVQPKPLTAFIKAETWQNPLLAWLFDTWGGIPLHRGEGDLTAFRVAERALADGRLLAIAPEGTRSPTASLQRAHPGIVLLAQRTGAPILPLVYYGHEDIKRNLKRLRRTPFYVAVGDPFTLVLPERPSADERQTVADEIMCRLAELLPEKYRGVYADLSQASSHYLAPLDPQL